MGEMPMLHFADVTQSLARDQHANKAHFGTGFFLLRGFLH
jgi:hypothetical protein